MASVEETTSYIEYISDTVYIVFSFPVIHLFFDIITNGKDASGCELHAEAFIMSNVRPSANPNIASITGLTVTDFN